VGGEREEPIMPLDRSREVTVQGAGRPDDEGLRALMSFHGEIRAALTRLTGLANGSDTTPEATAHALVRFFEGPLSWHDLDEEVSLLPRLRRLAEKPADLDEMLEAVAEDHEALESYIDRLLPHLAAVSAREAAPDHGLLLAATRDLKRMLMRHLALEEQTLFPLALALLPAEEKRALGAELRRRRAAREEGAHNAVPVEER
jgi:hypothetical protein